MIFIFGISFGGPARGEGRAEQTEAGKRPELLDLAKRAVSHPQVKDAVESLRSGVGARLQHELGKTAHRIELALPADARRLLDRFVAHPQHDLHAMLSGPEARAFFAAVPEAAELLAGIPEIDALRGPAEGFRGGVPHVCAGAQPLAFADFQTQLQDVDDFFKFLGKDQITKLQDLYLESKNLRRFPSPGEMDKRNNEIAADIAGLFIRRLSTEAKGVLSDIRLLGISEVDIWHGSHVVVKGDKGKALMDAWRALGARERPTSHYENKKGWEIQFEGLGALLFGFDDHGNLYFQMENSAATGGIVDQIDHAGDYFTHKLFDNQNVGPLGLSPKSEKRGKEIVIDEDKKTYFAAAKAMVSFAGSKVACLVPKGIVTGARSVLGRKS